MARIDSILSIVVKQGANELRVGAEQEPKMLAFGVPKRLSIPKTSEATLRELLGDILSPERDELLRAGGRLELTYDAPAIGSFSLTLSWQTDVGLAATFVLSETRAGPSRLSAGGAAPPPPPVEVSKAPVGQGPEVPLPGRLAALVTRAAALGASDLHLAQGERPFVRIDGRLSRLEDEPAVDLGVAWDHLRGESGPSPHSRDLGADIAGVGRIRLHLYATADGPVAAVRLLPLAAPSFASLRMPLAFDDVVSLPHGLVLVCGATGSGKSTTLAALAQEALRRRSILLVTLEDPIEYALAPSAVSIVRRRQLGRDVSDFASGLRDALREDPDVILVGEMRDPETIALALTAAETGHLVLASLHSRSAASAIERIVDSYPPERQAQIRVQLADSLRAIVAQRLLPRARGSGRVPAIEVLRATHAVAALVRDGRTAQLATAMQAGRREGMLPLEHCLVDLLEAGEITEADARAASHDPSSFGLYKSR
jgi:twitching motility protein PilT